MSKHAIITSEILCKTSHISLQIRLDDLYLKIGDYSFLRLKDKCLEQATQTARKSGRGNGTPYYMAPEVFNCDGNKPQPASDIWSVTITMMHMWANPWLPTDNVLSMSITYANKRPVPGLQNVNDPIQDTMAKALDYVPSSRISAKTMGGLIGLIQDYKEEKFFGCKVFKSPL